MQMIVPSLLHPCWIAPEKFGAPVRATILDYLVELHAFLRKMVVQTAASTPEAAVEEKHQHSILETSNYPTGASESQGVGIWKPCLPALVEYAGVAHGAHEAHGKGWRIIVVS